MASGGEPKPPIGGRAVVWPTATPAVLMATSAPQRNARTELALMPTAPAAHVPKHDGMSRNAVALSLVVLSMIAPVEPEGMSFGKPPRAFPDHALAIFHRDGRRRKRGFRFAGPSTGVRKLARRASFLNRSCGCLAQWLPCLLQVA